MRTVALSALAVLAATSALADATTESAKPIFTPTSLKATFLEQFTDDWTDRWTPSEATKKTASGDETFSYVGKWEVEESSAYPAIVGDKGLVAKTKAAHHAISAPFSKAIDFKKEPLVVQYEVKYQKGGNCGGGYLKLLEDGFQTSGKDFNDKTSWVVMFGPDLTCPGTKVHFIFRHKNPITGEVEEKHLKPSPTPSIEKTTNLYTLVVNPDDTYQILINGDSVSKGSLLESFDPPVNPEKEIDDASDSKPADWVDESRIADPEATKPADWDEDAPYEIPDEDAEKPEGWLDDEPEVIPDPDAEKPEEWDDEEDGDWVPPTVRNPKCDEAPGCGEWKRPFKANPAYKGKWFAPMIDNPAYKGEWKPRKIANPSYFEDNHPVQSLSKIGGVGIELWSMTEDILFDNIYVGHSIEDATALAAESFDLKRTIEAEEKKAEIPETDEEIEVSFMKDPVGFVRQKIAAFIEAVQEDPMEAFKTQPETGAALVAAALTLLGMFGTLFGVIGSSQKPVSKAKDTKKTDAPTASNATSSATTATATGKDDANLKKRVK